MYSAAEVGKLLAEVGLIACRLIWKCAYKGGLLYIGYHFVTKYW